MLQPGEDFPSEAGPSTGVSASPTAEESEYGAPTTATIVTPTTTAIATPTTAAIATPNPVSQHKSGLGTGAGAAIAIGGAIILSLVVFIVYLLGRHKSLKQALNRVGDIPSNQQSPFTPRTQTRSSNMSGYRSAPRPDESPDPYLTRGYPDMSPYPKPYARPNVDDVFPPTPASDVANEMPQRWNRDPRYRRSSSPPSRSAFVHMNNIEQAMYAKSFEAGGCYY
jgi:hypothetical protein